VSATTLRLPGELLRPIVWSDNRGKGEALRIGLTHGHGRYLGFIDADGDIPADGLAQFLAVVRRQRPDVVVGSKRHPQAQVVYPPLRRVYSTDYQCLPRLLSGLRVLDTQTGVKLVRRDVVAEVLPRMAETRFAFDLELLAVAHRLGHRQVAKLAVVIGERFSAAWVAADHQVTWFCATMGGRPSMEEVVAITAIRRGSRLSVYNQARLVYQRQGGGRFDLVVDEVSARSFEAARWPSGTPAVALVHQLAREVWFHELAWPVAAVGNFLLESLWLGTVSVLTGSTSPAASLAGFGLVDMAVLPEGVDPLVRPGVGRASVPTVVFVGQLAPNKRPDHVVVAFRLLRRGLPDAWLWTIGDGPMVGELRRDLPDGVELLGRVSEAEKQRSMAHCLVATWVREGWGSAVTEAAQLGLPAVAYDVDGLRDSVVVSGGMLVAPHPEALADALVEHLPGWVTGGLPLVEAAGVLPWPTVADELFERAAACIAARRRAADRGEDVAVAWRRALNPLAPACDRRAWSVAGIAALVAVAPLSEVGAANWADIAAGVGVAGTWAGAMRWPLVRGAIQLIAGVASGIAQHRRHRSTFRPWAPLLVVGLGAAAAQSWLGRDAVGVGDVLSKLGSAGTNQLALPFSPGARGAAGVLAAVLQRPVDVAGTLIHVVGSSAVLDQRLWLTGPFAAVGKVMSGLLVSLGLDATAAVGGGLMDVFNPYVLAMSGLNAAYLVATGVVPALAAWVVLGARTERLSVRHLAWMVPAAMGLGTVASSPPLLLACGAAMVGSVLLVGWSQGRLQLATAVRRTAGGIAMLVVVSAYWAVPVGLQLASTPMLALAAHRHWRWAARRFTLANTFWLNTAWNWKDRAQSPFATDFHHFPLVLVGYAVPVVAFAVLGAAGLRARTRYDQQGLYLLVVAATDALVMVVVATGTRDPGAPLFGLVTALPYGWLMQNPGRFLSGAAAAYVVLVGALLSQQGRRTRPPDQRRDTSGTPVLHRWSGRVLGLVVITMVLALPAFPLVILNVSYPQPTSPQTPYSVPSTRAPRSANVAIRQGHNRLAGFAGCLKFKSQNWSNRSRWLGLSSARFRASGPEPVGTIPACGSTNFVQ